MQLKSVFLLLFLSILFGCSDKPSKTIIKGKVVDFDTKSIVLLKPHEDFRFDDVIEIPVVDGAFRHELEIEDPEGFFLMVGEARENGGGSIMPLLLEEGVIDLTIYPETEFKKNVIKGGKLNTEYLEYKQKLKEQGFEKWEEKQEWTRNYIANNTTLISYFLLLQELTSGYEIENLEFHKKRNRELAAAFPEHPYATLVESLIKGKTDKIGKKFIDFSAPDLDGNSVTFSHQIEGKVALLNLWATWCAPCIRKSRDIIPIVEKYRENDFTVIGVAGEFKTTENLRNFLARKEFPWLNLVELDRQNNLWTKYGIPNSGGGMFLIDRNGEILMKDPTAKELDEKLATLLP